MRSSGCALALWIGMAALTHHWASADSDIRKGNFGAAAEPAKPEKVKKYPFHGTVQSVDLGKGLLNLAGKSKPRIFQIDDTTRITLEDKPKGLVDIIEGARVTGLAVKTEQGAEKAIAIWINGKKPKQKAAPKESK